MPRQESVWNEDRVAYLKGQWLQASATTIAKELGAGITRNAVIGKAARLGLPPKGGTWTKAQREARAGYSPLREDSRRRKP